MKQEFIRVGRIVNAHGIRGEVRVQPRRVSPALLTRCKTFYIDGQPITPTANHVHKELVLLKLPGGTVGPASVRSRLSRMAGMSSGRNFPSAA